MSCKVNHCSLAPVAEHDCEDDIQTPPPASSADEKPGEFNSQGDSISNDDKKNETGGSGVSEITKEYNNKIELPIVHATKSDVSDEDFSSLYSATLIEIIEWLGRNRNENRKISQRQMELVSVLCEKQAEQMRESGANHLIGGMVMGSVGLVSAGIQVFGACKGLDQVKNAENAMKGSTPDVKVITPAAQSTAVQVAGNSNPGLKAGIQSPSLAANSNSVDSAIDIGAQPNSSSGNGTSNNANSSADANANANAGANSSANANANANANINPDATRTSPNVQVVDAKGEGSTSAADNAHQKDKPTDAQKMEAKARRIAAKAHLSKADASSMKARSIADFGNAAAKISSGVMEMKANEEDAKRKETEGQQQNVASYKDTMEDRAREDGDSIAMLLNSIKEKISMDREIVSAVGNRMAA